MVQLPGLPEPLGTCMNRDDPDGSGLAPCGTGRTMMSSDGVGLAAGPGRGPCAGPRR
jgi:hypothetical protein